MKTGKRKEMKRKMKGQGVLTWENNPHGSNITINALLIVLFELKDNLSDVLYLQMDNCWRENKNRSA